MKKFFKSVRYVFEYLGALPVYTAVRLLPHSALFPVADFAGFFIYMIPPFRKLITANLCTAFPEKDICEIRRIARKNASNIVLTALEFVWFIRRDDKVDELIDYNPRVHELVLEYTKQGKGGIWVTPHIGNWELAGLKFKLASGIPFAVVVRPMNNPYLNKLVNGGRASEGTRIIPAKGAVRGMLKALKDGCFLATLIDQNTKGRDGGIFVDFFGLPVATSPAPALFARRMGSVVAVAGCIRKGKRYAIFIEELPKHFSEYKDDRELVQALMNATENVIRKYPEQYLWMYERWRYIPVDLPEETKKRYPYYAAEVTPRFFDNSAPKGSTF